MVRTAAQAERSQTRKRWYKHKCTPHHPEAEFLGILGRVFGEARHSLEGFALRQ